MKNAKSISFFSEMREVTVNIRTILYIKVNNGISYVHLVSGKVLPTRMTAMEFEQTLGEDFIKIRRGCLVSVYAVHSITDTVNLINGETLKYADRVVAEITEQYKARQRAVIDGFAAQNSLYTPETYAEHYRSFDDMPFAFADIEMVFDESNSAVDWVFRYGNAALAELEGVPLEKLIGNNFTTVFRSMDTKWLRTYEHVVLFEEMLNIVDYSPEIGADLNIICFPIFKGHCGCILFDVSKIKFFRNSTRTDNAIAAYITKMLGEN